MGQNTETTASQTVRATKDVDYVTAGETYTVEREARNSFFLNVRAGGGTSVPNWQFDQAVRSGAFVVVSA